MDKRYLIFISSTFRDLEKERNEAARAVLDLGHIPTGMERFPAMDEEQMNYIRSVIDDCDYYILIIGGKYGSISKETGKSYTEMEFDYALEKELPILVFEKSPIENNETGGEAREKFEAFRKRAKTERLIKSWGDAKDLRAEIALSLPQTVKHKPAIGWVRADKADSAETLSKLTNTLEENAFLKVANEKLRAELGQKGNDSCLGAPLPEDIAECINPRDRLTTWKDLFLKLAPDMESAPIDEMIYFFNSPLKKVAGKIRSTFKAWGLVEIKIHLNQNFWHLSESGSKILRDSL